MLRRPGSAPLIPRSLGAGIVLLGASLSALGGAACIDLFHSTDTPTLCDVNPSAAECGGVADGGVDTSVPPPDVVEPPKELCVGTPAAAESLATAVCATLGTCAHGLGESSYAPCVQSALQAYDCTSFPNRKLVKGSARHAYWLCMATARDCDAVRRCAFPEGQSACPTGGRVATACSTSGAARTSCPTQTLPRAPSESCIGQGRKCATVDLYLTQCLGPKGATCTVGSSGCAGTFVTTCVDSPATDGGLDRGFECGDRGGMRCQPDITRGPACVPEGASCTVAGAKCQGNTARGCVGGRVDEVDCAALKLDCVDAENVSDPLALCKPAGTPCSGEDECIAGQVQSCANGTSYRLPCTGRGDCRTTIIDGRTWAYCSQLP